MPTGYLLEGADGVISRLASVSGVDLKTVASTNLYTVPTGKSLVVTEVIIRITVSSGFAVAATVSVGKTAAFTEWLVATAMTGLSALGSFRKLSDSVAALVHGMFTAGEVLALNVTVGATATTLTATVDVYGYLV